LGKQSLSFVYATSGEEGLDDYFSRDEGGYSSINEYTLPLGPLEHTSRHLRQKKSIK
jgi:hypothetical protein